MDSELEAAQTQQDWPRALHRARELGYDDLTWLRQARWLAATDDDLTPDLLEGIRDPAWIAAAVLQRLVDSLDVERRLLEVALQATEQLSREVPTLRPQLFSLQDRLRTYEALYVAAKAPATAVEEEEDDPWAENLDVADEEPPLASTSTLPPPPPSLKHFLSRRLADAIHESAAEGDLDATRVLLERHGQELAMGDRLSLIELLPLHLDPQDYLDLLPLPKSSLSARPWRATPDWSETTSLPMERPATTVLSQRFRGRIEAVEEETGLVELALSLVQHGAARGVAGLEALGEELSLLSSLVYDRPPAIGDQLDDDDWTLQRWRDAGPDALVSAYLAHSTAATIVDDVQRLLRPFLHVLESRNERAGRADPTLPSRLLYTYILSAPIALVRSLVEASKPTLPSARRIVRDNADLARLALACLYGSNDVEAWVAMTAIFECLPAFSVASADEPGNISAFTALLTDAALAPAPPSLFDALRNCPPSALTALLDQLDIHLDSGETLAKWNAPQPLRWLVSVATDEPAQRRWLLRLVRRGGAQAENEDDWVVLMEDACRLAAPGAAFSTLSREEVLKLFFESLLSSGSFPLAKSLLNPSTGQRPLDPAIVHDLVLKASRDFYDNAESGNLHVGNMKLALECLNVAPSSATIRRERDFIEATSRLCSFKLPDQPAPIQIRLATDKLALVGRLLEQHADAYRHPDVILDLVRKLVGTLSPVDEVRTLGMIVDAALRSDEPVLAADACDRLVGVLPAAKGATEAIDVAWRRCHALGIASSFPDIDRRLSLLGRAMLIAPESEVTRTLLPAWRALERLPRSHATSLHSGRPSTTSSSSAHGSGAEAAARAARSLGKAATAYLRPLTPAQEQDRTRAPSPTGANATMQQQQQQAEHYGRFGVRSTLSKGFTQGVGWLIGAELEEQQRQGRVDEEE